MAAVQPKVNDESEHHYKHYPLNKRIYSKNCDKPMTWFRYFVAVTTLTLFTSWTAILGTLIFFSFFSSKVLVLTLVIYGTTLLPAAPLYWKPFVTNWVFDTWREYFKFSSVYTDQYEADGKYVCAHYPHGVLPLGPFLAAGISKEVFDRIYGISASVMFTIPMYRHFMTWMGCLPATMDNFKKLLSMKNGSVSVIVGGLAEMFMCYPDREELMLNTRTGFVRAAVEFGADIIPIYHFGNSQPLDFGPKVLRDLSRKLKFTVGIAHGLFGLPIPKPHPIMMVMGKAIKVGPKIDPKANPEEFNRKVEEIHGLVKKELLDVYEQWKGEFGWAKRPLIVT